MLWENSSRRWILSTYKISRCHLMQITNPFLIKKSSTKGHSRARSKSQCHKNQLIATNQSNCLKPTPIPIKLTTKVAAISAKDTILKILSLSFKTLLMMPKIKDTVAGKGTTCIGRWRSPIWIKVFTTISKKRRARSSAIESHQINTSRNLAGNWMIKLRILKENNRVAISGG